ncbi:MAG: RNA methyltransferase, partial [Deltaproteobacteria bacterium]|nr:RNA methyltransferase [Deltaproteobacteria bacterium]
GRSRVPRVDPVASFDELIEASAAYDVRILFHSGLAPSAGPPPKTAKDRSHKVLALIGPEGGFSDHELARAEHRGFVCRSLGPHTLRVDTAAIAAAVAVQYEFGCALW